MNFHARLAGHHHPFRLHFGHHGGPAERAGNPLREWTWLGGLAVALLLFARFVQLQQPDATGTAFPPALGAVPGLSRGTAETLPVPLAATSVLPTTPAATTESPSPAARPAPAQPITAGDAPKFLLPPVVIRVKFPRAASRPLRRTPLPPPALAPLVP